MLTSAQDEMGTRMTSAIARATLAESKITQMDKTVHSRVKSAQRRPAARSPRRTRGWCRCRAAKRAEERENNGTSLIALQLVGDLVGENAEADCDDGDEIVALRGPR